MYINNDLRSGRNVSAHTREAVQQGETAAVNFVSIKQVEVGARRVRGRAGGEPSATATGGAVLSGHGCALQVFRDHTDEGLARCNGLFFSRVT